MKSSARQKKNLTRKQPATVHNSGRGKQHSWAWWVVVVVCPLLLGLLVTFAGTWALFEFVIWNNVPGELVGKWVVQGGDQDGATFDFTRGGSMVARLNQQGQEAIIKARVTVEGKKLLSTTQNPHTRKDDTRALVIKTLTATELVLEDEEGKLFRMIRADE